MRPQEAYNLSNQAAGTYGPIILTGGDYRLSAHATWGGGNLKLNQLLPDGSTYLTLYGQPSGAAPNSWVNDLTADGALTFQLPPGTFQLVFTTGSGLSASLARAPTD